MLWETNSCGSQQLVKKSPRAASFYTRCIQLHLAECRKSWFHWGRKWTVCTRVCFSSRCSILSTAFSRCNYWNLLVNASTRHVWRHLSSQLECVRHESSRKIQIFEELRTSITIRSERRKVRAFALNLMISRIPKTRYTIVSSFVEFS